MRCKCPKWIGSKVPPKIPIAAPVFNPVEIEEEIVISRDLNEVRNREEARGRQMRRDQRTQVAQKGGEHAQLL